VHGGDVRCGYAKCGRLADLTARREPARSTTHSRPDEQTIEESAEIAREAARNGVEAIAATPHVRDDYPTTSRGASHNMTFT